MREGWRDWKKGSSLRAGLIRASASTTGCWELRILHDSFGDADDLASAQEAAEEAARAVAAEIDAVLGLRFGPWFEGERHAVAEDGARYTIIRLLNERFGIALGSGWRYSAEVATEADAIAACRAHDLARRGGSR